MGKGMDDPNNIPRRAFLTGVGAVGANMALTDGAQAGLVDELVAAFQGGESRVELKKPNYETEKYMAENGGELKRNMERLTRDVGDKMRAGDYNEYTKEADRKAAQNRDGAAVYEQRAKILEKLDPLLIPKMIAAYVKNGMEDKPLVILYQQLGGDIGDIKKLGDKGVAKSVTDRIMSELLYTLGDPKQDYGIAKYKFITFKEKPEDKKVSTTK
ncbi:MAG: hypothetical protein AAB790_02610 [Patescibacteria group bacterium]